MSKHMERYSDTCQCCKECGQLTGSNDEIEQHEKLCSHFDNKPHWTTEPPTKEGFYWVRNKGDESGESDSVDRFKMDFGWSFSAGKQVTQMMWSIHEWECSYGMEQFQSENNERWSEPVKKVG